MRLSWNEMRSRAMAFSREWEGEGYEKGQTQLFYEKFFKIFGMPIRRVATFEEPVKRLGDKRGFIDLFWKGVLLVEQKSIGRDLAKAKIQALDYFPGLKDAELPQYLLLSDFQNFELYDLEDGSESVFHLSDLHKHIQEFAFIADRERKVFKDQDPVNIDAAELVGALHDALEDTGYTGHELEQFLVRIVFCLFADDTGIFESRKFQEFIENRTAEDGADLSGWLAQLFQALNTPVKRRAKNLDEDLANFPYVNGDLFHETLQLPSFDSRMRECLMAACRFDWTEISPAIFGSLFQSVMDRNERREMGAHYTSEANILKVIEPLFLDKLRNEFEKLKSRKGGKRREGLARFRERLGEIHFFDPACGCGNFLIIAYRELRLLEIEVIRELLSYQRGTHGAFSGILDVSEFSRIDVDQFYGIEIAKFPAKIAEVAMWMMDHIMNNRMSVEFGQSYVRIPLQKSPKICVGNALKIEWESVIEPDKCTYILGNPPFRGHQFRSKKQQEDMARTWGKKGQVNRLDYVTCWFKKAVEYTSANKEIEIGFVSTNSITQGEQCGILWPPILGCGVKVHFAHRSFKWNSEARGQATVHCVIVGLTRDEKSEGRIYEYDHDGGDPHVSRVSRINGYLIDGPQYTVPARSQPRSGMLKMHKGSQPTDGARIKRPSGGYIKHSNLILDGENRQELLARDSKAKKWLRPYVGGDELISGEKRWCLWLKDADMSEVRKSAAIQERLDRVRRGRNKSPTPSVRAFASRPMLFTQDRQPSMSYLAIPEVSTENREYIPMDILRPRTIASNKLQIIPGAPLFYFGILTSAMHMAWMRTVTGRLGSGYSYAPAVYNSFPWPTMTDAQKKKIEALAQAVLDARKQFPNHTLDDLYDPDNMEPVLRRAHDTLDKVVDRLYKRGGFEFERERVEHLFSLYEQIENPIEALTNSTKKRRKK